MESFSGILEILDAIKAHIVATDQQHDVHEQLQASADVLRHLLHQHATEIGAAPPPSWEHALSNSLAEALEALQTVETVSPAWYVGTLQAVRDTIHGAVEVVAASAATKAAERVERAAEKLGRKIHRFRRDNAAVARDVTTALQSGTVPEDAATFEAAFEYVRGLGRQTAAQEEYLQTQLRTLEDFAERRARREGFDPSRMTAAATSPRLTDVFCPISLAVMEDPVMLFQSGHSYERESLADALAHRPNVDPKTNARFEGEALVKPNHALRGLIAEWKEEVDADIFRRRKVGEAIFDGPPSRVINLMDNDVENPGPRPNVGGDGAGPPAEAQSEHSSLRGDRKWITGRVLFLAVVATTVVACVLAQTTWKGADATAPEQSLLPRKPPGTAAPVPTRAITSLPTSARPTTFLSPPKAEVIPGFVTTTMPSGSPKFTPSPTVTVLPSQAPTKQLQSSAVELRINEYVIPTEPGVSMAIYFNIVVVGAPSNDNGRGCAFVLAKASDGHWEQQAKLVDPNGKAGDDFGQNVAIHKNHIIVASPGDDDRGLDSGSVHVFIKNGATWTYLTKLLARDGGPGLRFGRTVAIHQDHIVVGSLVDRPEAEGQSSPCPICPYSSGSAHVFFRNGSVWTHQAKLRSPTFGWLLDNFGYRVAIRQDHIIVSSYMDNDRKPNISRGSVHVFVRHGHTWTHQAKLVAPDGAELNRFGITIAIEGKHVVVGSNTSPDGSVYVFVRNNNTWAHQAKILPPDGIEGFFSHALAIHENNIIVASRVYSTTGLNRGSAHVFVRNGNIWTHHAELLYPTGDNGNYFDLDSFGWSVAVQNGTFLVGSRGKVFVLPRE